MSHWRITWEGCNEPCSHSRILLRSFKAIWTESGTVKFGVENTGRYSGIGLDLQRNVEIAAVGVRVAVEVKKLRYMGESAFQRIHVMETGAYGNSHDHASAVRQGKSDGSRRGGQQEE